MSHYICRHGIYTYSWSRVQSLPVTYGMLRFMQKGTFARKRLGFDEFLDWLGRATQATLFVVGLRRPVRATTSWTGQHVLLFWVFAIASTQKYRSVTITRVETCPCHNNSTHLFQSIDSSNKELVNCRLGSVNVLAECKVKNCRVRYKLKSIYATLRNECTSKWSWHFFLARCRAGLTTENQVCACSMDHCCG